MLNEHTRAFIDEVGDAHDAIIDVERICLSASRTLDNGLRLSNLNHGRNSFDFALQGIADALCQLARVRKAICAAIDRYEEGLK